MGFYGNITNTSNTTFQFDRIYPNRLTMDANVNNDGIFIGRYVLVEYQENAGYPNIYVKDGKFYSSPNCEEITRIKFLSGTPNDTSQDGFYLNEIGQHQETEITTFYKCVGFIGEYADFELIAAPNRSNYIDNFSIDEAHYSNEKGFKGYDSTVWVKTTETDTNGKLIAKYVNIADLNSVVPTFDITADAPTMTPITPHFDADSTNVYHKLHMQSPYGFRVKKGVSGQSDDDTVWYKTTYNKEKDETKTEEVYNGPADIYYNQAGFDPNNAHSKVSNEAKDNYIKLEPTGESGTVYAHGGQAKDIQEFSLHLPAIGNMMSDAWDIIHGPNRDDDMRETDEDGNRVDSLQGRLESIAAIETNQIPIKRIDNGQLVGTTINGDKNHEVIDGLNNVLKIDDFTTDDAWIKTQIDADNTPNSIAIHHTFNPTDDSSIEELNMNDYDGIEGGSAIDEDTGFQKIVDQDTIQLYVPKIDAAGHVIGTDIDKIVLPYGYKHFTTNGLVTTTDIDLDDSTGRKTTANNAQDTLAIDTKNKWLQIEVTNDKIELAHEIHNITQTDKSATDLNDGTNTITIQDTVYDNAGHVTENQKHTYILPYGFKYIEVANGGEEEIAAPASMTGTQTADNTQDTLKLTTSNKWILLDGGTEDAVQFGHLLKTVPTTTSTQSLSDEISQVVTFKVYDDSFDEAGHHNGRDTKTITMPFGYGKIKGDTGSTEATATFDELTISADDSWIATTVFDDQVNITHTGPVVSSVTNKSNVVDPNFGSTFTIEDWYFDDRGHKHTGKTHTVQFPKGSLNDLTATGSSVLTGISMVDETGDITQQNANVGTLTLAEYTQGVAGGLKISDTNTINGAFKGIQDYINSLDMSDTSTTQFITKITQTDGQVAIERAAAGTLQLGTASTDGTIPANSSLNNAFNITNARIKAEEDALAKEVQDRKNAIDALTGTKDYSEHFDTMREIANWLAANKDGVVDITLGVTANSNAIKTEESRATEKENELEQSLGTLEERLDILEDDLGTAAYTDKTDYATAEQGATTDRIANIVNSTDIVNYQADDFVLKSEYDALLQNFEALSATVDELRALVEQLNNPSPEESELPEENGEEI